jgi:hypothetical protein
MDSVESGFLLHAAPGDALPPPWPRLMNRRVRNRGKDAGVECLAADKQSVNPWLLEQGGCTRRARSRHYSPLLLPALLPALGSRSLAWSRVSVRPLW